MSTDRPSMEAGAAPTANHEGEGLTWLPGWKLREMIVAREVSAAEVVQHFLDRIEQHDSRLNAFRTLDVQGAHAQAERADKAVKTGGALGPLHGVPIAVKELLSVKGFPVCGSYITEGERDSLPMATRDDVEIERLRAAGAIIVGTTIAAVGPRPGASDATRLPRNPWDITRTAGGSSAGNGAAVAAGLLPMAIGDDGGGSVRIPSAFCGLVGLHPTRGRIPRVDYRSAAPRLTVTVGPMTRSVRDAAVALQALAGPDGRDFICLPDPPADYLAMLDMGISGKSFAWTEDFGFASTPDNLQSQCIAAYIYGATGVLQQAGARVTRVTTSWENPLLSWFAAQQLETGALVPGFAERDLSEQEMIEALECRRRNDQRFREVFRDHDFVINPTVPLVAPRMDAWVALCKEQGGDPRHALVSDVLGARTMLCNVLGLPAISIPAGFVDRLPVGLQVIGKPACEAELLQVAQTFLRAAQSGSSADVSRP